jgi:hypothetical protein
VKRFLSVALLLAIATLLGGFLAATSSTALVERDKAIAPATLAQALRLFKLNDPRGFSAGEKRQIAVPASLLDAAGNFLVAQRLNGRSRLSISAESAELGISIPVPWLPTRRYLNLSLGVAAGTGPLRLSSASAGRLPLPPALVDRAIDQAVERSGHGNTWRLARTAIHDLAFEPAQDRILVGFIWNPDILQHLQLSAVPDDEMQAIRDAHAQLAGLLNGYPDAMVPLTHLLAPLLNLPGEDRQVRQRAALAVLATWAAERNFATLVPEAQNWAPLRAMQPTLLSRHDTAQHFLVSAALAAWGNESVAQAIGTYKELADARHGSGFSFADLAADAAGSRASANSWRAIRSSWTAQPPPGWRKPRSSRHPSACPSFSISRNSAAASAVPATRATRPW